MKFLHYIIPLPSDLRGFKIHLEVLDEVEKLQIIDKEFIALFQSNTTNGTLDTEFFDSIVSESLKPPLS
jgi:hypothetical protein